MSLLRSGHLLPSSCFPLVLLWTLFVPWWCPGSLLWCPGVLVVWCPSGVPVVSLYFYFIKTSNCDRARSTQWAAPFERVVLSSVGVNWSITSVRHFVLKRFLLKPKIVWLNSLSASTYAAASGVNPSEADQ